MAIEKYTTKAFVLASFPQGEHDYVFKLFTRDFGLIFAKATSVRKLGSKLRAHLLSPGMTQVTIVRGKEVWRLTGAQQEIVHHPLLPQACALIERFVRGERPEKKMFDHIENFLRMTAHIPRTRALLLIHYVLLVDLGYADATESGARHAEEFFSWTMDEHMTHLILRENAVRTHVGAVLREMQL